MRHVYILKETLQVALCGGEGPHWLTASIPSIDSRLVGDIRRPASPATMQPPLRGRNVRAFAKRTCARNEAVIG